MGFAQTCSSVDNQWIERSFSGGLADLDGGGASETVAVAFHESFKGKSWVQFWGCDLGLGGLGLLLGKCIGVGWQYGRGGGYECSLLLGGTFEDLDLVF